MAEVVLHAFASPKESSSLFVLHGKLKLCMIGKKNDVVIHTTSMEEEGHHLRDLWKHYHYFLSLWIKKHFRQSKFSNGKGRSVDFLKWRERERER